jgi:hypothetical protein
MKMHFPLKYENAERLAYRAFRHAETFCRGFQRVLEHKKLSINVNSFFHPHFVLTGYGVIGVWRGARTVLEESQFSKAEKPNLTVQFSKSSPSKAR